ncbi:MAG: diguanylate cyclase [Anaerolineae bacterium]|nr:diguanylate cyclase [Anaerolineae bacterium]MDW8100794.1 diguanylate cyclase [Anaerolineae bacterium]
MKGQGDLNSVPAPPPRFRQMRTPSQLFVGGVILLAAFWFVWEAYTSPGRWWNSTAFLLLMAGATASQLLRGSARRYYYYHITPAFIFAGLALLGPEAAGLLILASYVVGGGRRRQRWYIACFNAATHLLSALLAYWMYKAIAGGTSLLTVAGGLGLLTGAILYVAANHTLVMMGLRFMRGFTLPEPQTFYIESILADFALLCVGACLAILWHVEPVLSVFALGPLILVYRALQIPSLEEEARVDPKTGLYNAKYANGLLEAELQRARQLHRPLSVLMADLDGLRRVNNTYGHLAGDHVLCQVADALRAAVGAHGVVARFGGEEFVAILPDCDAHEALAIAEHVRKGVEDLDITPPGTDAHLRITITLGVASFPEHAETALDLLHHADMALYQGKDSGRNQVCMADASHPKNSSGSGNAAHPSEGEQGTAPTDDPESHETGNGPGRRADDLSISSGRTERWLAVLIAAVVLAGAALYSVYLPRVFSLDLAALGVLIALALINEVLALDLYAASTVSSAVASLAAVFLLGPAGVAVLAPVEAITHALRRRPPWYKVAFNLSGHMLAGAAASVAFRGPGARVSVDALPALILPAALAALAYYAVNVGLVATALALSERSNPIRIWREQYQWLWVHYLAVGFIALALAAAYLSLGVYGILAFIVPLFIVRYAQKQYIDRTADNIRALKALNQDLMAANAEVRQMNEELLGLLARIIDFRDPYVYNHSEQVATYALAIAREMGLSATQIETLRRAALCHDLGKIGIPDAVLNKPGRLTDEEYQVVKEHVNIGAELLKSSHVLHGLIPGVRHHHERWDGNGYPARLRGEEIPVEARILAVADTVEALASDRPYKRGMTPEEILAELRQCAGTHFDPAVVEAFTRVIERYGPGFIVNSARRVTPERTSRTLQPSLASG